MAFKWIDSRVGKISEFESLEEARTALLAWITKQRNAGEPVSETSDGEWSDSRVTTWIADSNDQVVRIGPELDPGVEED
jgi:hypothetical protein